MWDLYPPLEGFDPLGEERPLERVRRPRHQHQNIEQREGDGDAAPPHARDPDRIGQGADELAATELIYRCRCTRESLLETLRRFSPEQKADLFVQPGPLEVRCDYCGTLYPITQDDLAGPA